MVNHNIKKDKFTFSIIISIYNVEKYLKQSIDSVISQSLNFEKHVQLILVNDGSTDNSLNIALEYQNMFPDNITVISQENQGISSARNHGLEYVEGTYVNFLDSDDYLSNDTLKEVKDFFEKHHDVVDVVSIKIQTFERKESEHPLNFKFNENKVINLVKTPNNPQLHAASSFIKSSSFKNRRFKLGLVSSEDTNILCKLLLEKKSYGVLKSPTYFYRKRNDANSLLDLASSKKEYFTDRLKNHFMDVINYCLDKEGEIPKFIQYTLAYNIQWMVTSDIPEFFNKEEEDEFNHYFDKVLSYLSIESLSSKKIIKNAALRNYLVYRYNNNINVDFDFNDNDVLMKSNDKKLDRLSSHVVWINHIELNDGNLKINGSFNSMFDSKNILFQAFKENRYFGIEPYSAIPILDGDRGNTSFFSKTIMYLNSFSFKIPLKECGDCKITLSLTYRDDKNNSNKHRFLSLFPNISFVKDCLINNQTPFFVKDSKIVFFKNNTIEITDYENLQDAVNDSGLFDEEFYVNQLSNANEIHSPLNHYLETGYLDGLNPSKKFNTNSYLKHNLDVEATGINPLVHYILFGEDENREIYPVHDLLKNRVLTKEIFEDKLINDDYYKDKWEELSEIVEEIIKFDDVENILELCPYKAPLVQGEDVMDINKKWVKDYPFSIGTFIHHDCSKVRYPIEDKKYDLIIASQILDYCGVNGEQIKIFNEFERISKRVIVSLPYKLFKPQDREHHMIDEDVFDYWANGRKPIFERIKGSCILRIYEFH